MKLTRRLLGLGAAAALTAGALSALQTSPAQAHGAMMIPGNRTYLCWEDGLLPQGGIANTNPACAAAVAKSGPNSLYNWFAQLRSDGAGRTVGFIPDGKLCSADAKVYDFSGFDLARDDWPVTHLTSGANLDFNYSNWAAHPGTFYLYVTKDGFDPTKPLGWGDLESEPFAAITNPPQKGSVGSQDGHYYWTTKLPSNKSGRHIIYSVWSRSDSTETFYNCSDVVFDGGKGEVTGIRGSSPVPTTTSPKPTTSSPAPATSSPVPTTSSPVPTTSKPVTTKKGNVKTVKKCKTGKNGKKTCKTITKTVKKNAALPGRVAGAACVADVSVVNAWPGGYQAVVRVTNNGTTDLTSWTASGGSSAGVTQVWGGPTATATSSPSGLSVTATRGTTLAAGASVSTGVVASGAPSVGALTCSAG